MISICNLLVENIETFPRVMRMKSKLVLSISFQLAVNLAYRALSILAGKHRGKQHCLIMDALQLLLFICVKRRRSVKKIL